VFLLRQNGVAFKEIAEIQKCSLNTAIGRMQYAMKNLQKILYKWKENHHGV
jgi:RNA polymerase sigma-70 factor (ECF subfamily)